MAELGARRVLKRAPFNRLRSATVPPFEVFLVLPLLGGVALIGSIESRDDSRPADRVLVTQVAGIAANLKRAVDANSGALSETQVAELAAAMGAAQDAAQAAEEGPMGEAMRDVASALDDAAASLPEGSPLTEELERLAFEAEAASVDSAPGDQGQAGASAEGEDLDEGLASGPGITSPGPNELESIEPTLDADGPPVGAGSSDGQAGDIGAQGEPGAGFEDPPTGSDGDAGSPTDGETGPTAAVRDATDLPEALTPTSAAPAPWWPERDDDLVRAWLARIR